MPTVARMFEMEQKGATLVATPAADLDGLGFHAMEVGARPILCRLGDGSTQNVVVDFRKTKSFDSTALGFFIKLWKRVCDRQGHLAFCNLSDAEREVLCTAGLKGFWPICTTLEQALNAVKDHAEQHQVRL